MSVEYEHWYALSPVDLLSIFGDPKIAVLNARFARVITPLGGFATISLRNSLVYLLVQIALLSLQNCPVHGQRARISPANPSVH